MATVQIIGPADHGRPMDYEEYMAGDYEEGYHYELIDGKLYVTPMPNLPENRVEMWLILKLHYYALEHPDVANYVSPKARVFVPGRRRTTCPEPDVTLFRDFPLHLPIRAVRWQDVSPILVAEVLTSDDPSKDLVRNVELYFQVPSIREYWILDAREEPDRPMMIVHRRYRGRWSVREYAPGTVYTTKLLPGFELLIDPRR
jgi:Uma2 family endonuclease